jgi:hypothetical protein
MKLFTLAFLFALALVGQTPAVLSGPIDLTPQASDPPACYQLGTRYYNLTSNVTRVCTAIGTPGTWANMGSGTILETIPFLLGGTNVGASGTTNNPAINYGTGVTNSSNNGDFPSFVQFASAGGTVILHSALSHTWTGAIDIKVHFSQNGGGSGNIQWNAQTGCYTAGSSAISLTYNTVSTVTVTVPASGILGEAAMLNLNTAACAADSDILIKVFNSANGSGGTTYVNPVFVDKIVLVMRHT